MSELVNIEPGSLSNIIRGRNYPMFSTLEKILEILDSSFGEVFNFDHHDSVENLNKKNVQILNDNPDRMKDFYKIAKALIN